jgi:hypothetical protein
MKFFVNVALVALLATPALAQYGGGPPGGSGGGGTNSGWQIDILPEGNTRILSRDTWGNGTEGVNPWSYIVPTPFGTMVYPGMTSFSTLTTMAGTHTASTNGVFQVKLTWQGTPASRPAKVYIMEAAYASYSGRNGDGSPGSGFASNGFTSLALSPFGGVSSGKRLRQFSVGGNVVEFSSPSLSAAVSISIAPGQTGAFGVAANYSAALDDRGVFISNPVFEDDGNWKKGPNFTRVANVRNPDGSMTVDSYVPHGVFQDGTTMVNIEGWQIATTYNANTVGFQTGLLPPTQVDWSFSGEGNLMPQSIFQSFLSVNQHKLVGQSFVTPNPWPKGKSTTIKVKVTDLRLNMNATAENSYTVQWHAPYENWQLHGTSFNLKKEHPIVVDTPGFAYSGGGITCHWHYDDWMQAAIGQGISTILSVIGDAGTNGLSGSPAGLLSSLCGALGLGVAELTPKPDNGTAVFDTCWPKPLSVFPSGSDQPRNRYKMRPMLFLEYNVRPYRGEHYEVNGYSGFVQQGIAKHIGIEWAGEFILIGGNGDNNGPP